jgi:hypothetical protein
MRSLRFTYDLALIGRDTMSSDYGPQVSYRIAKLRSLRDALLFWPIGAIASGATGLGYKIIVEGASLSSLQRDSMTQILGVFFFVALFAHLITRNVIDGLILVAEIEQERHRDEMRNGTAHTDA